MTYEDLYTPEEVRDLVEKGVCVPAKEDMTCNRCPKVNDCDFAWDLYNTQGDCLASK